MTSSISNETNFSSTINQAIESGTLETQAYKQVRKQVKKIYEENYYKNSSLSWYDDDSHNDDVRDEAKVNELVSNYFSNSSFFTFKLLDSIFLFGKDESFVKEKCAVLENYTPKADPEKAVQISEIYHIKNEKLLKESFSVFTCISNILPRIVVALYAEHKTLQGGESTFGAAIVAAGISPIINTKYEHFAWPRCLNQKIRSINLSELSTGDIVTLNPKKKQPYSFVYLDRDISLSINLDRIEPLKLHSTRGILNANRCDEEILDQGTRSEIRVYQKVDSVHSNDTIQSVVDLLHKLPEDNDELVTYDKEIRQILGEKQYTELTSSEYFNDIEFQDFEQIGLGVKKASLSNTQTS